MVRYSFPGKVVLVTGGSRGMGAAVLEAFARAGATCVVNYYPDDANRKDARPPSACAGTERPSMSWPATLAVTSPSRPS